MIHRYLIDIERLVDCDNGGQYGGNLVFYWLYLEFYENWRPNVGVIFMIFGVNKCNDVIRFNIGRSENKMAANMAKYGIKMAITRVLSQLETQCWCQLNGSRDKRIQ